jgi:hypothetical protein
MKKGLAMQETVAILFSITVVGLMWFIVVFRFPGAIPFGCDFDGICENTYTETTFGYDNRLENDAIAVFPMNCWKSDCCYDFEHALDVCEVAAPGEYSETWLYNVLTDEERACMSSSNFEVLIDCSASRFNCENDTCIQSCNYNDICEPGEMVECYDCW